MDIKMTGQYKTREGHVVKLYEIHKQGMYPVHGAVFRDGLWEPCCWGRTGKRPGRKTGLDLVAIQEERWVVFTGQQDTLTLNACFTTQQEAEDYQRSWLGDEEFSYIQRVEIG